MTNYLALFYIIILIGYFWDLFIESLNLRQLKQPLSNFIQQCIKRNDYSQYFPADQQQKAKNYLTTRTQFGLIHGFVSTMALLVFVQLDGFGTLWQISNELVANRFIPILNAIFGPSDQWWLPINTQGPVFVDLVFLFFLSLCSSILSFPFSLYSTFVIEEKFGFNRTSLKTFFGDRLKGILLSTVIGLPIAWALLSILYSFTFRFSSQGLVTTKACLVAWLFLSITQIVLAFLAPAIFMPLFNKFVPLEDGPLKRSIEELANKENFHMAGIFTMDGSKRSSKANAFFTGFGPMRRIVLFDTLVAKHSVEELTAILAHEIGHYKLSHTYTQLLWSLVSSAAMFATMPILLSDIALYRSFGINMPSASLNQLWNGLPLGIGLILFSFYFSPISSLFSLFSSILSRRHEFQADAYAARAYGNAKALMDGLIKLSSDSLSQLDPHPFKVFLEYSHPPVFQRLQALEAADPGRNARDTNIIQSLVFFLAMIAIAAHSSEAATKSSVNINGTILYTGATKDNEGLSHYGFHIAEKTSTNRTERTTLWTTDQDGSKSDQKDFSRILVKETTVLENNKLLSYEIDQKQINEVARAKLNYSTKTIEFSKEFLSDGQRQSRHDTETLEEDTYALSQMQDCLRDQWHIIKKGDKAKVRFIIASRLETVGFHLKKDGQSSYQGKPATVVKVTPSAFFISLFVTPLYATIQEDGDRIILKQIEGRMPIKVLTGPNDWSDIEGLLVLQN